MIRTWEQNDFCVFADAAQALKREREQCFSTPSNQRGIIGCLWLWWIQDEVLDGIIGCLQVWWLQGEVIDGWLMEWWAGYCMGDRVDCVSWWRWIMWWGQVTLCDSKKSCGMTETWHEARWRQKSWCDWDKSGGMMETDHALRRWHIT